MKAEYRQLIFLLSTAGLTGIGILVNNYYVQLVVIITLFLGANVIFNQYRQLNNYLIRYLDNKK
jgi:hypothetical protein